MLKAMSTLHPPRSVRHVLCFCGVLATSSQMAWSALTLTLDVENLTATWTGSAVLDIRTLDGDVANIYIASSQLDIPVTAGYIDNDPSSFAVDVTINGISNGSISEAPNSERIYVDDSPMLIGVRVVDIIDNDGPGNRDSQITVTGNGVTYSINFNNLSQAQIDYLKTADGSELRFFRADSPENDLGEAGTVVIIPEPSQLTMLGLAGAGLLVRRRR